MGQAPEDPKAKKLPLNGIRVLELSQAVMGPSAGLILADLGAEVIRVERAPDGDETRRLKGFGRGFFPYFNRNKKSIAINLKSDEGKKLLDCLIESADVLIENFAPGTIERLGFGYERLHAMNPRLIFCSLKGFMPGPYSHRPALDEVVQMMSGLAYATGPYGRPLRAGTSVTDIAGGTFGALGILVALLDREKTGQGQFVTATLFEAVTMLMAQHLAYTAVTGKPSPPMPERGRGWSIYDLFESAEGDQVFIGITSDRHWARFCETFGFDDLGSNEGLRTNNERLDSRPWLMPELQKRFKSLDKNEIMDLAEKASIPFSPVCRPEELFDDPHLNATGALLETELEGGIKTKLPKLPLRVGDYDFGLRHNPPKVGEGSRAVLMSLGISAEEIEKLMADGILGPVD